MKHFVKYLVFLILTASCTADEFKPVDIGLNYFPLQKGLYQVYQIDETRYSAVAEPETLKYELMAEIIDSFPNPEGNYTYVLHRSKRTDSGSAWQPLDTWSVRGNDRELIVTEGNISYVKLIFPLRKSNTWNGNKYNASDEDEYELTSFDEPLTIGGTTFEKTLAVNQENNEDFIVFLDQRKEIYAREVGLILREVTQLHYCSDDNCRGQQIVENGIIYKQEIIEYGVR